MKGPRHTTPPLNMSRIQEENFVRAAGSIPEHFNERLKAMARRQGKTAEVFIGEMLMRLQPVMDQMEARIEKERLRQQFGDEWLNILQQAEAEDSY